MSIEPVQHQPKKEHIEWRRTQVLEQSSQGRSERDIATILKLGLGTVSRDMSVLNKQAQDTLKNHIQERLPAEYLKCRNGLDQVLKMAWNTVIMESPNQAQRLQALSLIADCYRHQMDLATNGVIITDSIKMIQDNMNHLNNQDQEKKLLQDIKQGQVKVNSEEVETETHNEIF